MFPGKLLTWRVRPGKRSKPRKWLAKGWATYQLRVGSLFIWLWAKPYWGMTAVRSLRVPFPVRVYFDADLYREMDLKKRKPADASSGGQLHLAAVESTVFSTLHPLVAHCTHTQYDDGSTRKVGWITLKTMGASWIVEVKDPDTCSKLTVVQTSLDDALALASVLLESEECPWEPDTWLRQNAAKNSKK